MKVQKKRIAALTGLEAAVRGALLPRAQMAELVDAPASGAGDRKVVEVRVLFWAPYTLPEKSGKIDKTAGNSGFFVSGVHRFPPVDLGIRGT